MDNHTTRTAGAAWKRFFSFPLILRLFLFLAPLLLAACSEGKGARKTITVYLRSVTPVQDAIWMRIADEYQKRHPELRIKVIDIAYDVYWSKLFTMISSGNPPDVVLMDSGLYPSFVLKGGLMDLSARIKQPPAFPLAQYYPNSLAWLWIDKKIYGLPLDTAIIIPFYNKDMFDRAGVPYPAENWTWQDYLEISKKLTQDTNGDGRADVWGTILPPWEPYVWACGADWVDNPNKPTRCAFDSPAAVQAIQWILDAKVKHGICSRETQNTFQIDPFLNQKAAIVWNGHWAVPDYMVKAKFRWDVATLPIGPKGRAGWNFGSCFSIPARTKHPDEAWEMIQFFCGPVGTKMMAAENFITPSLRAVAESPEFLGRPPEHHRYFIEAIPYGHIFPKTPAFQELRALISTELERVWIGEAAPKDACERISRKGTELLQGVDQK